MGKRGLCTSLKLEMYFIYKIHQKTHKTVPTFGLICPNVFHLPSHEAYVVFFLLLEWHCTSTYWLVNPQTWPIVIIMWLFEQNSSKALECLLCVTWRGTAVKPFTIAALKLIKIRSFRQCKKKIWSLDLLLDVHTVSAFVSLRVFFFNLGLAVQAKDKILK